MLSIEELKSVTLEDIKKSAALLKHKAAYNDTIILGLPYRILYEYKAESDKDYAPLTRYYPFYEVPNKGRWDSEKDGHYTKEEWFKLCMQPNGDYTEDGKPYYSFIIPKEIQALIDKKGEPFRLWDLESEDGKQGWLYYFALFLMPYEDTLQDFTCFDVFGDNKHTQAELNERIDYYMSVIDRCNKDPSIYRHDIQIRSKPLDICYSERDKIPCFDKVCKDTTTRAYRLNNVIKLLEGKNGDK